MVPFPPGGGTDVFARIIAEQPSKALGTTGGHREQGRRRLAIIGMESVAKSNPDGYTLLFNPRARRPGRPGDVPGTRRFDPVWRLQLPVAVLRE